ncbi:guanitoxin biosynthesis L-enduracididine beta-hydroxylase GntD [Couchioplanes caeruleus]|uniref:Fe(II)/alpha-ketoglutarate-dependent arginine beta-hydroxylase n=1 Tax=Couchioplanes caeruleus TaxID=56438 RepID=A0A3N1GMI6_9ACTN|nr:guanitoxin biosynthesis L-enduracididine beta-hydroxylase GntD [Couchioplanes caeruleus]ROP31346.1 Fe(II)/alpha-ketoglutarate-dependent arginine beta-hydroxylase [Couchioplanes caeruleus]
MYRVEINSHHRQIIDQLVDDMDHAFPDLESEEFLSHVPLYAQDLPRDLRKGLMHFRQAEPSGACLVSGYTIDDEAIGPTPAHWADARNAPSTRRQEIAFSLISALLGDVIAWASQQDGAVVNDVLPIAGREYAQAGSGSKKKLEWHTEDAFHPCRADYIGLMCMRNHDRIETTMAFIDDVKLSDGDVEILREARFPIRPDDSHSPAQRKNEELDPDVERLTRQTYSWIEALNENPDEIAVLFGDKASPYLRVDPYFIAIPDHDEAAKAALHALVQGLDRALTSYALKPGEIIYIDNYKTVHGRNPFTPRFDGTDRWLKRLNLVRDLRKSRAARLTPSSHTIY